MAFNSQKIKLHGKRETQFHLLFHEVSFYLLI